MRVERNVFGNRRQGGVSGSRRDGGGCLRWASDGAIRVWYHMEDFIEVWDFV